MSIIALHTSTLFDPQKKAFVKDVSITVDQSTGNMVQVWQRTEELKIISAGDIDLRGKVVLPGLVDAHTHIFLHSYE